MNDVFLISIPWPMLWGVALVQWVIAIGLAVTGAIIANNKGRNSVGWALLSLIFGWPAVILVAVMDSTANQAKRERFLRIEEIKEALRGD